MGRPVALAVISLFVALQSTATDLVILRDDSRRSGLLRRYVDGRFRLDDGSIARGDVAWIGLEVDAEATPPAASRSDRDQIHLTDGSVHSGTLSEITLGDVALEEQSFERDRVRWVYVAGTTTSKPATAGGIDLSYGDLSARVTRRAGGVVTGDLLACVEGTCTIEGSAPIARNDIASIAFGTPPGAVPAATAQDVIRLRSGATHEGIVLGISPIDVVTDGEAFVRSDVAAIAFAAPVEGGPTRAAASSDPSSATPQTTSPAPPRATPPAPVAETPASASASPPSAGPARYNADGTITNGLLWTGNIHGTRVVTYQSPDGPVVHSYGVTVRPRLREVKRSISTAGPESGARNYEIALKSEGTSIHSTYQQTMCSDQHRITYDDEEPHSYISYREGEFPAGSPLNEVPQGGLARLSFHGAMSWVACPDVHGWGLVPGLGTEYVGIGTHGRDPEFNGRPLSENRSRFRGQYTSVLTDTDATDRLTLRWDICRQGNNSCSAIPDFEADPCRGAEQESALDGTCAAQLQALLGELVPLQARYEEFLEEADRRKADYENALLVCEVYDTMKSLLELAAGATAVGRTGAALQHLRKVLEKTASGDLQELLYPAQVKKFLDLYNQVNAVWTEMTESELEGMTRTYEGCSGKVPAGTYLSGKKYIENVTAAMNLYMSEIAPKQNDVRAKALACSGRRWRSEQLCSQMPECCD